MFVFLFIARTVCNCRAPGSKFRLQSRSPSSNHQVVQSPRLSLNMSHSMIRPWYCPVQPQMRRRRDATRVLAGAFDRRPLIQSYPPPPPFEEREQKILGIYPNGIVNDFGIDLPADGSSGIICDLYLADRPHLDETADVSARQSGKRAVDRVIPSLSSKSLNPPSETLTTNAARKSAPIKNAVVNKSQATQPPTTESNLELPVVTSTSQAPNGTKQKSGGKRPSTSGGGTDGPAPKKLRLMISTPAHDSPSDPASTPNHTTAIHQPSSPFRELSTYSLSTLNATPPAEIPPSTPASHESPDQVKTKKKKKKGWKGWVEATEGEELPKDKLVNLDNPQLLKGVRRTRKGTRYTSLSEAKWQETPATWATGSGTIDGGITV